MLVQTIVVSCCPSLPPRGDGRWIIREYTGCDDRGNQELLSTLQACQKIINNHIFHLLCKIIVKSLFKKLCWEYFLFLLVGLELWDTCKVGWIWRGRREMTSSPEEQIVDSRERYSLRISLGTAAVPNVTAFTHWSIQGGGVHLFHYKMM